MTKQLNKEVNRYFRQIRTFLPIYRKEEYLFLKQFKQSVRAYAEETPDRTIEDVIGEYGDPQTVAYNYLEGLEPEDLCKKVSLRRYIRRGIIILLVCAIGFTAYRAILLYDVYLEAKNAIITTEQIVIG